MKTKELFKRTLLVLMALLGSITASAYDFSAENAQGQILYYKITSSTTVEITNSNTFDGMCYNGYGDVFIPSTVERNGNTYTVTGIGEQCFSQSDITSISLPNTIITIGDYAFDRCYELTSLNIPENVTTLGKRIISGTAYSSECPNLQRLYYNARYADGDWEKGTNPMLGGKDTYFGPFDIPNGCEIVFGENVEHIPNYFLCNSQIETIYIPSSVTSIGKYAFYDCWSNLTTVTISSNVTTIGIYAFAGCSKILSVISFMPTPPAIGPENFPSRTEATLYIPTGCLPNYVTVDCWKEFKEIKEPSRIYFEDSNVEAICVQNWDTNGDGCLDSFEAASVTNLGTVFQGKKQITKFNELQYFTSLSNIPDNAFQGCTGLTEITLPTSVRTLGSSAFMGCSHLASITNLNNISKIGESAFANCTNLTIYSVNAMTIKSNAFQGCTGLTSLNISATAVESNAFQGCTGLTSLNISATTVESNAFQGCTNLATVSFNAKAVESNTFDGCTHLTSVTLGSKVTDIKEGAFRNCTALTSINIPGTVITISGGFEGCTSLSTVTLNSGTKYIVNSVFQGCSSLRSITLPNGLVYIGESVFEGTGLSEINIPSSVTSIQSRAFYGCDHLTKVIVNWTTPLVVPDDAFPNRANQWLIVPQGTKESYQAADVWKDFKWIFQDGEVVYGINVGGVVVSDQNVADITGASITGGSVSFDPATHVLTLTDATITSSTAPGIQVTTDYVFNDLTIHLVGDNNININSYSPVALRCQTTITGPGSLTVKLNGYNGYIDMIGEHPLIIEGGCTIYGSSISGSNSATLKVRGADTEINLSSFIYGFGSVTLEDGLDYVVPEGGSYDANIGYTVDSNGNRWTNGVIIKVLPYVVYDSGNTTLTFYCDSKRSTHNGATETAYLLNEGANYPGWYNDNSCGNVSTVVFDPSFANARPTTTANWFAEMYNLTSIEGTEYLNTSEVTDMGGMFWECGSLPYVDLSSFDTHNVTDMHSMFAECYELTGIDVSGFDTQNVTDMGDMFSDCSELTSLDVSNFNTAKVTDMYSMFGGCGLTTLDLSSFDTHNVTDMRYMFSYCSELQTIYVGDGWSTAAVTYSDVMFYNCTNLVGGKGTTYSDSNPLDKTYAHIDGGPSNPGYFSEKGGAFLRGDVNGDSSVNIADVTSLIDYLLSSDASGVNLSAADCNQDSSINIADVTALIDYLLSGTW